MDKDKLQNLAKQIEGYKWSKWKKFPDPSKGEYLCAPFGHGVYQLRNTNTGELVLFGRGKNLAQRMSSLLPQEFGAGTRNNSAKRNYIFNNINYIEYRTVPLFSIEESKGCEKLLRSIKFHIFNS